MKKFMPVFLFILMILSALFPLYADAPANEPLEKLLDSSLIAMLGAGQRPVEIQFKNGNFLLLPRNENLGNLLETIRAGLNPSVIVETLYLYQKPPQADKVSWTETEISALYNQAVALSTLRGIQYYSASRGVMRTFYETSSVIDGPSTKNPLPDPVLVFPRSEYTIYARQKDLTFGDNIYQYTYRYSPGALVFIQENLTDLKAGILTAVKKNNLHSVLAMLDVGDCILIYVVSMAKASSFPGMNDRIGASFSNRAEAILQWTAAGADRAFGKVN